jgi:starch synthase (maltosyl-transferring)
MSCGPREDASAGRVSLLAIELAPRSVPTRFPPAMPAETCDPKAVDGRQRVVIENVMPTIDGGRFAVKRTVGQRLIVTADVFADGHDVVRAVLLFREAGTDAWHEAPMTDLGNDAWRGGFPLDAMGVYEFTVCGWVDAFESWHRDLKKRIEAGQEIGVDLQIGAQLAGQAARRARGDDARRLTEWQTVLAAGSAARARYDAGASDLEMLARTYPDRSLATQPAPFRVRVDRPKARFSTWYELFPRSTSGEATRHGTFRDCAQWLPRLAEMGFDVVYLPPIHPIGTTFRKGKNNAVAAQPGDVGSPWAIGAADGGHKSILTELGTLAEFRELIAEAQRRGMEIALDIAFQCSPDHPYVKEHPQWFRQRPDGTVQYAENPPKKYQDIVPFDFETKDWRALWEELTDVFLYWCGQGVRIFRVDNPHTKPFAFWEYAIAQVKEQYPDALFLSEAFTRPKIMYRLAKLGFTQSYTYFTWRNSKAELTEYLTELTQTEVSEFFGPNLWPNTPDILVDHLQHGGRAAFVARLVLAATLGASYGIYGPAFETMEHEPREPGSEEYLNSEKYELRRWDLDRPDGLHELIAKVNRARRENPALQWNSGLRFHPTDNDSILCYSKQSPDGGSVILTIVNLNFHGLERGFVELSLPDLRVDFHGAYDVHDLLTDQTYTWHGPRNFVELDPARTVAHVMRVLPRG